LIQEKRKPIIPLRREDKTVTIGIGFQCPGAVVLCADRQITRGEGLKYEQDKILIARIPRAEILCGMVYAHRADVAPNLFKDVVAELPVALQLAKEDDVDAPVAIKEMLKQTFRDKKPETKGMELLFGFAHMRNLFSPFLMYTYESNVLEVERQYIGAGDSPVIRYVGELIKGFQLTVEEAPMLGVYLVSLANRFIPGCGGGPDVLVMFNGKAEIMAANVIEKAKGKLPELDAQLSSSLWKMFEFGGNA